MHFKTSCSFDKLAPFTNLGRLVQAFGRVVSCRLVVDKASGRLKGTAFADFADAEAAQKAAEACAKARWGQGLVMSLASLILDVLWSFG